MFAVISPESIVETRLLNLGWWIRKLYIQSVLFLSFTDLFKRSRVWQEVKLSWNAPAKLFLFFVNFEIPLVHSVWVSSSLVSYDL